MLTIANGHIKNKQKNIRSLVVLKLCKVTIGILCLLVVHTKEFNKTKPYILF